MNLLLSFRSLLYCCTICFWCFGSTLVSTQANRNHLVVLCHGIMGCRHDLSYLHSQLMEQGFKVLSSKSNEYIKSLDSVQSSSNRLKCEIEDFLRTNEGIDKISFVGNSLGGIYARYCISLAYDTTNDTLFGLQPIDFVTIATPHLGVQHHTIADQYNIRIPAVVKRLIAKAVGKVGNEIFTFDGLHNDDENIGSSSKPLLYNMATDPIFLDPLRSFQRRRVYANMRLDGLVPLGTAAFVSTNTVNVIRNANINTFGIVATLPSTFSDGDDHEEQQKWTSVDGGKIETSSWSHLENTMIQSLNALNWQKVVVHFPGFLPLAHNKICAMTKPLPIWNKLMGHEEGRFVIDNIVDFFCEIENC